MLKPLLLPASSLEELEDVDDVDLKGGQTTSTVFAARSIYLKVDHIQLAFTVEGLSRGLTSIDVGFLSLALKASGYNGRLKASCEVYQ